MATESHQSASKGKVELGFTIIGNFAIRLLHDVETCLPRHWEL